MCAAKVWSLRHVSWGKKRETSNVIHSLIVGASIEVDHLGVAHDEGITVAGVDFNVSARDVLATEDEVFPR